MLASAVRVALPQTLDARRTLSIDNRVSALNVAGLGARCELPVKCCSCWGDFHPRGRRCRVTCPASHVRGKAAVLARPAATQRLSSARSVLSRRLCKGLPSALTDAARAALGTFAVPIVAGMAMSRQLSTVCLRSRGHRPGFGTCAHCETCPRVQMKAPVAAAPAKRPRPRMPAKKNAPAEPSAPELPPADSE